MPNPDFDPAIEGSYETIAHDLTYGIIDIRTGWFLLGSGADAVLELSLLIRVFETE